MDWASNLSIDYTFLKNISNLQNKASELQHSSNMSSQRNISPSSSKASSASFTISLLNDTTGPYITEIHPEHTVLKQIQHWSEISPDYLKIIQALGYFNDIEEMNNDIQIIGFIPIQAPMQLYAFMDAEIHSEHSV